MAVRFTQEQIKESLEVLRTAKTVYDVRRYRVNSKARYNRGGRDWGHSADVLRAVIQNLQTEQFRLEDEEGGHAVQPVVIE